MISKKLLSDEELFEFLERFPIPTVQSVERVAEGSENTNYLVTTVTTKYILTILENSPDQAVLPYIHDVFVTLETRNALTPKLITGLDGRKIHSISNSKKAVLQTFLDGYTERDPEETQCFAAGRALANFHNTLTENNLGYMPNSYNHNGLSILFTEHRQVLDNYSEEFKDLSDLIQIELASQEDLDLSTLKEGVIHGIFFRENVLFTENMVTGIIDLWFSCTDFLAYDLALALNDFGFRKGRFVEDRFWAFYEGYNSIRTLDPKEIEAMPQFLKLSAIRFLVKDMMYCTTNDASPDKIERFNNMIDIFKHHLYATIDFSED